MRFAVLSSPPLSPGHCYLRAAVQHHAHHLLLYRPPARHARLACAHLVRAARRRAGAPSLSRAASRRGDLCLNNGLSVGGHFKGSCTSCRPGAAEQTIGFINNGTAIRADGFGGRHGRAWARAARLISLSLSRLAVQSRAALSTTRCWCSAAPTRSSGAHAWGRAWRSLTPLQPFDHYPWQRRGGQHVLHRARRHWPCVRDQRNGAGEAAARLVRSS
jgi:hypothetical protein